MQRLQLTAANVVKQVMTEGRNLNQVLDEALSGKYVWEAQQRGAIQDLSFGTIRFHATLKFVLGLLLKKPVSDASLECLLLVALYQLEYTKATQHTVVDQAVTAARALQPKAAGLTNAVLRNFLRNQTALMDQANAEPVVWQNHPAWWISELNRQYGAAAASILECGNARPPMTLRVNRYRGNAEQYKSRLAKCGMSASVLSGQAILLDKPVGVDKLPGFFEGDVSVQDSGAQFAALMLDVSSGMRVLDACAAPGGKTAHILEVQNVAMVALDIDGQRLERVAENLKRIGLSAVLVVGDAAHPESWWDGKQFDRILADVPCSASGVVRRHPDIKWLRRAEDIQSFASQQQKILMALWPLLKVGGKLLYATCSVFQQENEHVILKFLAQQPDARRLAVSLPENSTGQLVPNRQHDGFFYALLYKAL